MKCPVCGQAELVHDTRNLPFTYKGQTTEIANVTADWCDACGECLTGPGESDRVMKAMTEFRQQVNAQGGSQELIRTVRKQLHLSQREAAELFGGGPNAFSRYERGSTEAPQPLVQLFKLLGRHPELLKELRAG
ncbi:antitoxin [Stutzerimonas stutzeri]|uniref:Antitoxin n=1 Tax=Stutzerimonas stutzeri TaxID=316 RepID=A0A2S4ARM2_STUST|nr:type II TA system antitoxin MqsA family protein [Stutzerimonas stutzeri]MCQ4264491.1 type II toxin-antitoxin system MqsA family antitoxin [Stutzerimonas stutzeri]MDH2243506.1 type II toxin-antitoxin system MqsA family antitoxin [Pseudomonas sp. GD03909]POH84121.1 antitoxin [Stutzerimonas stutzeri]